MKKLTKFFKRFGTDIAGVVCLILVLPVGALPGPGGIPLLIAGLSLLSVHNAWARGLLDYAKRHSASLTSIFFPNRRGIQLAWDIFAFIVFFSAIFVEVAGEAWFFRVIATGMGAGASTVFMLNRSRLERVTQKFKRKKNTA
jgi:hypothetical protein